MPVVAENGTVLACIGPEIFGLERKPAAETWSRVWRGRGRRVSAEKFFLPSPPNREIWGGWQGTHCLLELNASSVYDAVYGTIYLNLQGAPEKVIH